jgi:hypothetical protein
MRTSWLHHAKRAIGLPRDARADLLAAQWALLAAQCAVWTRPRGTLVGSVGRSGAARPTPHAERRAQELALAVTRAAGYGLFRPQCLVRALALVRMLDARGLAGARVRVGVAKEGAAFSAHAWVEYGDLLLGDRPERVGAYVPLPGVEVLSRP